MLDFGQSIALSLAMPAANLIVNLWCPGLEQRTVLRPLFGLSICLQQQSACLWHELSGVVLASVLSQQQAGLRHPPLQMLNKDVHAHHVCICPGSGSAACTQNEALLTRVPETTGRTSISGSCLK